MTKILTLENVYILCLVLFVAVIVVIINSINTSRRLRQSIKLINELYQLSQQQNQAINELKTKQVVQTDTDIKRELAPINAQVQSLFEDLAATDHKVEQLMHDDPQLKMYKRGSKLASEGASVDEIVEACDLPHSEAEVLVSLQSKTKISK